MNYKYTYINKKIFKQYDCKDYKDDKKIRHNQDNGIASNETGNND